MKPAKVRDYDEGEARERLAREHLARARMVRERQVRERLLPENLLREQARLQAVPSPGAAEAGRDGAMPLRRRQEGRHCAPIRRGAQGAGPGEDR